VRIWRREIEAMEKKLSEKQVLSLLALLVQKYKY
jgi:hypothetical protein